MSGGIKRGLRGVDYEEEMEVGQLTLGQVARPIDNNVDVGLNYMPFFNGYFRNLFTDKGKVAALSDIPAPVVVPPVHTYLAPLVKNATTHLVSLSRDNTRITVSGGLLTTVQPTYTLPLKLTASPFGIALQYDDVTLKVNAQGQLYAQSSVTGSVPSEPGGTTYTFNSPLAVDGASQVSLQLAPPFDVISSQLRLQYNDSLEITEDDDDGDTLKLGVNKSFLDGLIRGGEGIDVSKALGVIGDFFLGFNYNKVTAKIDEQQLEFKLGKISIRSQNGLEQFNRVVYFDSAGLSSESVFAYDPLTNALHVPRIELASAILDSDQATTKAYVDARSYIKLLTSGGLAYDAVEPNVGYRLALTALAPLDMQGNNIVRLKYAASDFDLDTTTQEMRLKVAATLPLELSKTPFGNQLQLKYDTDHFSLEVGTSKLRSQINVQSPLDLSATGGTREIKLLFDAAHFRVDVTTKKLELISPVIDNQVAYGSSTYIKGDTNFRYDDFLKLLNVGNIRLGDTTPTLSNDVVTKSYVDAQAYTFVTPLSRTNQTVSITLTAGFGIVVTGGNITLSPDVNTRITTAQTTANAAQTAAGSAQTTATAAQTTATTAQGLAAGAVADIAVINAALVSIQLRLAKLEVSDAANVGLIAGMQAELAAITAALGTLQTQVFVLGASVAGIIAYEALSAFLGLFKPKPNPDGGDDLPADFQPELVALRAYYGATTVRNLLNETFMIPQGCLRRTKPSSEYTDTFMSVVDALKDPDSHLSEVPSDLAAAVFPQLTLVTTSRLGLTVDNLLDINPDAWKNAIISGSSFVAYAGVGGSVALDMRDPANNNKTVFNVGVDNIGSPTVTGYRWVVRSYSTNGETNGVLMALDGETGALSVNHVRPFNRIDITYLDTAVVSSTALATQLALYYTKIDADAKFALISNVYSRTASDTRYYTKAQADARYPLLTALADYYTKTEADARYALGTSLAGYYTKTQGDARYMLKADAPAQPDLAPYALKTDLAPYALLEDLDDYATLTALGNYALTDTVADTYMRQDAMGAYATLAALDDYALLSDVPASPDLSIYALSTDLNALATYANGNFMRLDGMSVYALQSTLGNYALAASLSNYALLSSLASYYTKVDADGKFALKTDLLPAASTATMFTATGGAFGSILFRMPNTNNKTIFNFGIDGDPETGVVWTLRAYDSTGTYTGNYLSLNRDTGAVTCKSVQPETRIDKAYLDSSLLTTSTGLPLNPNSITASNGNFLTLNSGAGPASLIVKSNSVESNSPIVATGYIQSDTSLQARHVKISAVWSKFAPDPSTTQGTFTINTPLNGSKILSVGSGRWFVTNTNDTNRSPSDGYYNIHESDPQFNLYCKQWSSSTTASQLTIQWYTQAGSGFPVDKVYVDLFAVVMN